MYLPPANGRIWPNSPLYSAVYVSVNSSSPHPPPPPRATPGPSQLSQSRRWGYCQNFSAKGRGLRRFPSWRLVDYNMADFAGKDTEFVCQIVCLHEIVFSFNGQ